MVLSLPRMGERPMMTEAKADLTCWLASDTNSWEGEERGNQGLVAKDTPVPTEPESWSAVALVTHGAETA